MRTRGARARAKVDDRIGTSAAARREHRRPPRDARDAASHERIVSTRDSVQRRAGEASANDLRLARGGANVAIGALLPQARRLALSDAHMRRILIRDGPQTIAGLAQRMHLHVQTARYRIARLRQQGALQWVRSGGGAYVVSLTTTVASERRKDSSSPPSRGEGPSQAGEASAVKVRTVVISGHLFDVVFSGRESLTCGTAGLGSTLSGRGFPVRL
jgi:hypothetical protein